MHANQGPVKAFSSKSHVQTARESHDLNMDFPFKQLRVQIPMQEQAFSKPCLVNLISKDTHLAFSMSWSFNMKFMKCVKGSFHEFI